MKIPAAFLPPSTPFKKKFSLSSPEVPNVVTCRQLGEGSFYKIFLTNRNTVLRISKSRMTSTDEIRILKCLNHPFINKMYKWWVNDSHLHFEMERCDFSLKDREMRIENFLENFLSNENYEEKKANKHETLERNGCEVNKMKVLRSNDNFIPVKILDKRRKVMVSNENILKNKRIEELKKRAEVVADEKVASVPSTPVRRIILRKDNKIANLMKARKALNPSNLEHELDTNALSEISVAVNYTFPILNYPRISPRNCRTFKTLLPNFKLANLEESFEDRQIVDRCLDGESLCDGERIFLLNSIFPTSELSPHECAQGIFDPFSESYVNCSNSIVISEDSDCVADQSKLEKLAVPRWISIMMYQISKALSYAHSKNIVHMDVKPENILIKLNQNHINSTCNHNNINDHNTCNHNTLNTPDNHQRITFYLCDFNISKFGEGPFGLDGDKMYMAPEVLNNRCYFKSDVYSLGLIYLELTGKCALPSGGEEYLKLRKNDFTGWKIDEILRKMLEKDPLARCSAEEVSSHFYSEII